tara:strand:+ start:33 stop:524 length:492 start_codon:yes stop_codon:yes gene_type:complete
MYWEEVIELIKTHANEPKSVFPNPYNDSDDYVVYQYERGTVKTSYIHIDELSEKLKNSIKKYLKYGLENLQFFCSLGASEGMGEHTDDGDVLIICLEGEMAYTVEGIKPVVLKAGDTIYIQDGLKHCGISSTVPRICLSTEVRGNIPKEEVTYYFGSRYRTKN